MLCSIGLLCFMAMVVSFEVFAPLIWPSMFGQFIGFWVASHPLVEHLLPRICLRFPKRNETWSPSKKISAKHSKQATTQVKAFWNLEPYKTPMKTFWTHHPTCESLDNFRSCTPTCQALWSVKHWWLVGKTPNPEETRYTRVLNIRGKKNIKLKRCWQL